MVNFVVGSSILFISPGRKRYGVGCSFRIKASLMWKKNFSLTSWGLSISTESGTVFLFNGEMVQPSHPSAQTSSGRRRLIYKMSWKPFPRSVFNADSEKISLNLIAWDITFKKNQFYHICPFFQFLRPSRYFEFFSVKKRVLTVRKVLFVISVEKRSKVLIKKSTKNSTRIWHYTHLTKIVFLYLKVRSH